MQTLLPLLAISAPRALFVILFVVGVVMALTRRARHPNASRLAIIAFVLLITGELVQISSQTYLISHGANVSRAVMRNMGFLAMGNVVLSIAGMTLLVLAVFADRNPAVLPRLSP